MSLCAAGTCVYSILQSCQQEQTSRASTTSWFNDLRKQGLVGNSSLATASWEALLPRKQCKNVGPSCQYASDWEEPFSDTEKFLLFFYSALIWSLVGTFSVPYGVGWRKRLSPLRRCKPLQSIMFSLSLFALSLSTTGQCYKITDVSFTPAFCSTHLPVALFLGRSLPKPQSPHLLFIFRQVRSDAALHIGTHTSCKSVWPGHRAHRMTPLLEGGSGDFSSLSHSKQDHCQY